MHNNSNLKVLHSHIWIKEISVDICMQKIYCIAILFVNIGYPFVNFNSPGFTQSFTLNVDCAAVFHMCMDCIENDDMLACTHVLYIFFICLLPDDGPAEAETCSEL